jgi:ATP-dependent DNA ligase
VTFQRKKPASIGIKAAFPGFIEPTLASSISKVPSGERWLHEIKFDGYRVQLISRTTTLRSSPDEATTGPNGSRRSPPTPT